MSARTPIERQALPKKRGVEWEMAAERISPAANGEPAKRTYDRSTIEFPYNDLDDAVALVRAVHDNAGQKCTVAQLAGYLDKSMTSGAFRGRLSNVGTFRLAKQIKGEIHLTELGRRIVDTSLEKPARAEAFLSVPLYQAIFDKYDGFRLPPASAIEREMIALGVAEKQTQKARQALMRSARQAGFFIHGEDRLIQPSGAGRDTKPVSKERRVASSDSSSTSANRSGGGGEGPSDPVIAALISKIPGEGTWDASDRADWFQMMAGAFDMAFGKVGLSLKTEVTSTEQPDTMA